MLASLVRILLDALIARARSKSRKPPKPPRERSGATATKAELAARIIAAMQARGYAVDRGDGEVTIVYLEGADADGAPNDDGPNEFNDRRVLVRFESGEPVIAGNWEATTEPGRRFTERPINPAGAARIAFGQQRCWQVGVHRGDHEALVQTGGAVTVHRDANRDYAREGDRVTTGWFGINQHWGYDFPADDIRGASAGCLVGRTRAGHREFMDIVKSDPRYRADPKFIFATTVMPAEWVQQ